MVNSDVLYIFTSFDSTVVCDIVRLSDFFILSNREHQLTMQLHTHRSIKFGGLTCINWIMICNFQ